MATVLVTGANRGIGLQMVVQLAARGDEVLACCRNPDGAKALKQVAGNVSVHGVDVASSDSVARLASALKDQPIDVLINNAGAMGPPPPKQSVLSMDFAGWSEAHNVNAMGPVRMLQALMPNLKLAEAGKIMTVTSQMGALSLDMTFAYAYCASKAAVNKFMKLAAIELKDQGIAVGLVHPGWVRTDMGGDQADLDPADSAAGVISVTDQLSLANTGGFWKWNGETHDW